MCRLIKAWQGYNSMKKGNQSIEKLLSFYSKVVYVGRDVIIITITYYRTLDFYMEYYLFDWRSSKYRKHAIVEDDLFHFDNCNNITVTLPIYFPLLNSRGVYLVVARRREK